MAAFAQLAKLSQTHLWLVCVQLSGGGESNHQYLCTSFSIRSQAFGHVAHTLSLTLDRKIPPVRRKQEVRAGSTSPLTERKGEGNTEQVRQQSADVLKAPAAQELSQPASAAPHCQSAACSIIQRRMGSCLPYDKVTE